MTIICVITKLRNHHIFIYDNIASVFRWIDLWFDKLKKSSTLKIWNFFFHEIKNNIFSTQKRKYVMKQKHLRAISIAFQTHCSNLCHMNNKFFRVNEWMKYGIASQKEWENVLTTAAARIIIANILILGTIIMPNIVYICHSHIIYLYKYLYVWWL